MTMENSVLPQAALVTKGKGSHVLILYVCVFVCVKFTGISFPELGIQPGKEFLKIEI